MKVPVFPICIVWTGIREQFWSWNWAVNFCLLNSYNVSFMTIKKATSSSFLPFMPLIFMLTNFSPLKEVDLLILDAENALFCLSLRGEICLTVQSCTEYQNKNKRSWAPRILGMSWCNLFFVVVFSKVSYSHFILYTHFTWVTFHCLMTIQGCAAAQSAVRFAIPSINSRFNFFSNASLPSSE